MTFLSFLRSHALFIAVVLLFLACWCAVAAFMGAVWLLILLTVVLVIFGAAAYICIGYCIFKRRMKKIERLKREMDELYLLGEMLPRPINSLEEVYFSVMKAVSRAAVDRVYALRRELNEYLDYVEAWVHEIKTPLTSGWLILSGGGDLKKLKVQLRRADNLAESILYYARIRTRGTDVLASRFSVRGAAEEAVKSEMELLIVSDVGIEIDGDFYAFSDRQAIIFSVKQLLVNCAKYCRGCKVRITAEDNSLIVEDDGQGIPPHELPLIFSRGYVGSTGRKNGGGTGMGLYIVRRICEKCGVEVTAESEVGKYARFIFVFMQTENAP